MARLSLAWLCAWLVGAVGRPVADVKPWTNGSGALSEAVGDRHLRRRLVTGTTTLIIDSDDEVRAE